MSVTIELDLKEILAKIEQKIDKLDAKIDKVDERLTKLEIGQAEIKTEIKGVEKRLESQEFISRGVLIGLIVTILGGLAKLFGFVGNP